MSTQDTQTATSYRCITEHDPKDPYYEKGYTAIAKLLKTARYAIQAANELAKTLPPSPSNGCRKRFALYEMDDIEEYMNRNCYPIEDEKDRVKRLRSEEFKKDVKARGGLTPFHKSDEIEEIEEGEATPCDLPAASPINYVEGRSYTPDYTPPSSPLQRCYSPYDPDA